MTCWAASSLCAGGHAETSDTVCDSDGQTGPPLLCTNLRTARSHSLLLRVERRTRMLAIGKSTLHVSSVVCEKLSPVCAGEA